MRRTPPRVYAIGLAVFFVTCIGSFYGAAFFIRGHGKGNLTDIHNEDPELKVAIETARLGLPGFRKQLAKPDPDVKSLAIKAKIPTQDGSLEPEYLYVDHLKASGNDFEGILADRPIIATKYHKGDPITVKDADVVDWVILHNDNTHDGGYTDAVLTKRQSK